MARPYTGKNYGNKAGSDALGPIPANKPGTHGGINPAGGGTIPSPPAEGSTGNPGTELPWEGADSTSIGFDTQLPPLTHLGGSGGHEAA